MTKPYSLDLRERVVARVLAGETTRSVASMFEISPSAVSKWMALYRESGHVAPRQIGGYKPVLLNAHRDFVHACFEAEPELSLRALQRELADRGVKVSYGAIWNFVHGEGLSFKKNRIRQRAGSPRRGAKARAVEKVSDPD